MSTQSRPSTRDRLALQRSALVVRSALLRTQAVSHGAELQAALGWVDRVQDTWIWLRQRPPALMLPVVTGAVIWVVRKPSRLWRLSWRAWSAWRLWQRVARRSRYF
jgi:hypothetical protein